MACIVAKELVVGYHKKAVSPPLNFCVQKGDYLCVLGENGTGKSTLLKTLLGLEQSVAGTLLFDEQVKHFAYLPQRQEIQKDFPATVEEIVLSGTICKMPFFNFAQKKLARQKMQELSVSHLAKKAFATLSGGQQQRVLLARALCTQSNFIILDEPIAGLDPQGTKDMYDCIKNLHKNGATIIMVTHHLDALLYASHVLRIAGDACFFGTTAEYLQEKQKWQF